MRFKLSRGIEEQVVANIKVNTKHTIDALYQVRFGKELSETRMKTLRFLYGQIIEIFNKSFNRWDPIMTFNEE